MAVMPIHPGAAGGALVDYPTSQLRGLGGEAQQNSCLVEEWAKRRKSGRAASCQSGPSEPRLSTAAALNAAGVSQLSGWATRGAQEKRSGRDEERNLDGLPKLAVS